MKRINPETFSVIDTATFERELIPRTHHDWFGSYASPGTTSVSELCEELEVARTTVYRYASPDGRLRVPEKNDLNAKTH